MRVFATVLLLLVATLSMAAPGGSERTLLVAIDPGHGGKDSGAIGPGNTMEKDVVLQIARRLQKLINGAPGLRATLTRNDDRYLRLDERIAIARRQKADLFVSIHADAAYNAEASGSSVFILSTKGASSAAARWLANKENESDRLGGSTLANVDNELMPVVFDIYHDAILADSMHLADKVLDNLNEVGDVHKGHVERAGFAVLKSPDIPSILVETAFLSNPHEEARLRDPRYQQRMAQAIMDGIHAHAHKRLPQDSLIAEAPAPASREPVSKPARSIPIAEVFTPAATSEPVSKPARSIPIAEALTPAATSEPVSKPARPLMLAKAPPLPPIALLGKPMLLESPPPKPVTNPTALPSPPPKRAAKPAPPARQVYVIRRGESLADVAERYRVSLPNLRSVNGLNTNQLRVPVGTPITIPAGDS